MSQHIVFVGAGGAGVSSLVLLFHTLGLPNIVAIDSNESELTKKLKDAGINVIIGHGVHSIQQDDIVIYSDAAEHSPEVQAAREKVMNQKKRVFPPMSYFQFLGELSKYMCTVSVAGTHGKSTTTALTATVLEERHPDFGLGIVGAPINQRGHKNYTIGKDRHQDIKDIIEHILFPKGPKITTTMKKWLFVVEADEYNRHFLHLDTDYALITNIELDHADVYGTFEKYLATFEIFAQKVKKNIVVLSESQGIQSFCKQTKQNNIIHGSIKMFDFINLLGTHNHENASLAYTFVSLLSPDTSQDDILHSLNTFQGLRRRGELLGENKYGVSLFSDYAHHPAEVASTLQALQEKYPSQPITCIFQPHQARRVVEFRDAFTNALQASAHLYIYDIYTARESVEDITTYSTTSEGLRGQLQEITTFDELGHLFASQVGGNYVTNIEDIKKLVDTTTEGVVIICTAGNLDRYLRTHLASKKHM